MFVPIKGLGAILFTLRHKNDPVSENMDHWTLDKVQYLSGPISWRWFLGMHRELLIVTAKFSWCFFVRVLSWGGGLNFNPFHSQITRAFFAILYTS
jgi:hypothetical protein